MVRRLVDVIKRAPPCYPSRNIQLRGLYCNSRAGRATALGTEAARGMTTAGKSRAGGVDKIDELCKAAGLPQMSGYL